MEGLVTALATARPLALPQTVVSTSGVTKRFGRVQALRNVNLTIRAGRVTAILGPNGAGKSTLIKLLLGLARPDRGSLAVQGQAVGRDPAYRAHLGYMPQHPHFPVNLTGREVVRLLRDLRRDAVPEDDELFEAKADVRTDEQEVRGPNNRILGINHVHKWKYESYSATRMLTFVEDKLQSIERW